DVEPKKIILDSDDQPVWKSAKTVAPTPSSAIIQLDVDDNFVVNTIHLNLIRKNKFNGYLPTDPHDHICEFLSICGMFKYGKTQSEAVKLMIFPLFLSDEAKMWFNELNEESITLWEQMRSQNICESLTEAWLRLKSMLQKCHGHGLTKGAIIQIFYHGLDEPTQGILDVIARGIFLYKNPNQDFQLLEDKVPFKQDLNNTGGAWIGGWHFTLGCLYNWGVSMRYESLRQLEIGIADYWMCYDVCLDNQHDPHMQMLLEKSKNPSDQQLSLLYPHPIWISPPLEYPLDYSLWEVILNGDSLTPTRIVDGVVQVIAPTTAEQRIGKKNELKARETLLMALPNKHQLKFNIHKDDKSLMEAIEKSTNESVSAIPSVSAASSKALVSNLLNVDSLSDAVIYSFFASQSNSPQLENEDLKQIDVDYLEEIDLKWQMSMLTMRARRFLQKTERNHGANGTTAIGFDMSKVECYNCHRRGHFARDYRSLRDNRNKGTLRRTVPVEVSASNALVSQCDAVGSYDWSFQANEEPTNYALMAYASSGSSKLRKKFEKAKKERDDLKLTLEKFQTSFKNLSKLLESQVSDKTGLGYDSQVFNCDELHSYESDDSVPTSPVNDSETITNVVNVESVSNKPSNDMSKTLRPNAPIIEDWTSDYADESEIESVRKQKEPSFLQTSKHVKPPRAYVKTVKHPKQAENLITDNQKSRGLMSLNAARPVPTAFPHTTVKSLRPVKHVVNKAHSPGNPQQALKDKGVIDSGCLRHITRNISFLLNFEEFNGGYVAFGGNLKSGKISGKGKIKTGKLDFDVVYFVKELKFNLFSVSQMCDKKNSVLFTDTECVVLSSDFKLPDENHVLLRVLRENNMYNVDLKNVVPSRDLTCLFANATLDESNLWHRRLEHINFKTMNKLVKGNLNEVAERKNRTLIEAARTMLVDSLLPISFWAEAVNTACYQPLWSTGLQDPQNTDVDVVDAAFNVQENENKVYVSPSGSDKTKKHDEKAKREAKGKIHVGLPTRVRDLRDEFEEFSVNSTNRVNAASAPVTAAGPNPTNNTNNFNIVGLSDAVVTPNFRIAGKSSFVDLSNYPDDLDIPALGNIVLVDLPKGKSAIGSKWVFRNKKNERGVVIRNKARLGAHGHTQEEGIYYDEVFAPIARIKAMRLFLAYASFMSFMVYQMDVKSDFLYETIEEEVYVCQPLGFKDLDYPDKVYKVVQALYGLHQAPGAYVKSASTLIKTKKPLLKDPDGEDVDVHIYRYLKGKPHMGLWYPKDSPFNLVVYSDSDYAGASLDRKSTTGGCQFLELASPKKTTLSKDKSNPFMASSLPKTKWHFITAVGYTLMLFGLTMDAAIHLMLLVLGEGYSKKVNDVVKLQALIDGKKVVVTEDVIRQDLCLDDADGVECLHNEEIFAELARMGYEKPPPKLTFYKAFFSTQ
nr:copia protein [Tanacetum cinerariifolium]